MAIIKVDHLTKKYGYRQVLNDVSFELKPGKIYGLLGRNGAGKSTLLNLITNRIFPTKGEIDLADENINNNDAALTQFYLMSEPNLYPKRTTLNEMWTMANQAYGNFDFVLAKRLLAAFGIQDPKTKLSSLSTGLQTAAKLTVALAVNAQYIFLDEPVLGLDAQHRDLFYHELLKVHAQTSRTYIVSTHLINEIQDLLEHVLILKQGQMIIDEDVDTLLARCFAVSGPSELVDQYVSNLNILRTRKFAGDQTSYVTGRLDEMLKIPDQLRIKHLDLQQAFICLTEK